MPTAVWTGTISFGLVNVGVKLYPATQPKDVRFHLVDAEGRRVHYRRFVEEQREPDTPVASEPSAQGGLDLRKQAREPDPIEPGPGESEVPYEELLRGYENDEGDVVTFTVPELERARPERSRSIDLEDFVELSQIDPVYFEKSYYVVPSDQQAERPYSLLHAAMARADRVGIGRFVLRTKPHLVAIRAMSGALVLHTLFFSDEVRSASELVSLDDRPLAERQLAMAQQLIDLMRTDWEPSRYADEYREELLRMIASKSPVSVETEAHGPGGTAKLQELMEALKASVEAAKGKEPRQLKKRQPRQRAG